MEENANVNKNKSVTYFGANIKLLRKRKNLSQEDVAFTLALSRSTVKNYENSTASPKIDNLIAFSDFFNISIDTLLRLDLSGLKEYQLSELDYGFDVYVSSAKLRVLAKTVDSNDRENIEFVPQRAQAGYTTGYADPEFISELPVFSLPFLSRERKYRTFEITGDSMLPVPNGAHVIGEFVEDWNSIKDGIPCIVVLENEGIVFKNVMKNIDTKQSLTLVSLNPLFEPYDVSVMEVKEIWKFTNFISQEIPEGQTTMNNVAQTVNRMSKDVNDIKNHIMKE